MSLVEVRNVWKSYGGRIVLERLRLKVDEGEFVAIVGPSGCGKSTFLRLLLGTEEPDRGVILLDGRPLAPEPGPDRGIVFQMPTLLPHLRAVDNVAIALEFRESPFLARLFGRRRLRARERALALLERVGLAEAAGLYPAQLSGGMRQRLSLAQSLIAEPRLLLLDEPFSALDPGLRAEMGMLVHRLWRERTLTVFMVTHDVREAFALGTRVLVFDRVRHDPQAPDRYGSTIVYDLPRPSPSLAAEIGARLSASAAARRGAVAMAGDG